MPDQPPTPASNTEIEHAFERLFGRFFIGHDPLCEYCGRGLKVIIHDECRRIGLRCGWDPRDTRRPIDYGHLCDNLISMHRCYCKPTAEYEEGGELGTKHSAKEEAMWGWHGLQPGEYDRRLV